MTTQQRTAAAAEISRTLDALFSPGQVIELRRLGPKKGQIDSGYFTDREKLISAAAQSNGTVPQFIVANVVDPRLIARYNNHVEPWASATTKDEDVTHRRWLPIEFDPDRPTGIPASNDEHTEAHERAQACQKWLASYGWPSPVYADSGNGAWLLYRLPDLPNTDALTTKIKRVIEIAHLFFNGANRENGVVVKVDKTVYNAARLVRLFGTTNLKGDGDEETKRHNRASCILDAPDAAHLLTMDAIDRLLAAFPEEKDEPQNGSTSNGMAWGRPEVEEFVTRYNLDVAYDAEYASGYKWVLSTCPFNAAHTDKSAVITLRSNGRLGFKCHHDGCNGKNWKALRGSLDPSYGQSVKVDTSARHTNGASDQPAVIPPPAPRDTDPIPWRIYRGDAIDQIIAPRQLIKGYLSIGTVALLIGPSEAGKSTIAVDMANKVAQHYGVLYVAGEDGGNVRSQIRAWELLHNKPRSANLALVDGPVLLHDDMQVATFISAARAMAPRLIVIDTLSSCIPGVEENSSDIGHVTYNLNRISDELGASVLVLHHPLKYDGETFRGHSSLNNNTHTMMVASRDEGDDTVSLKVIRHKGARAAPTTLRLVIRATDIIDPDDGVLSAPVALPANRVMLNDDFLSARQLAILQHLDDLDADGGATSSEVAREFALKFKTTEGVIRKDIASLVRRRLMSPGVKRNDPRVISAEGRKRIAVDHTDHTDHSAPNDPFVINARLDENTTIGDGAIFSPISPVSPSDAINTVNDPNDPQRSVNDPQVVDHLPDPSDMSDPYDPVFSTGSYGSFTEAGELRAEDRQRPHTKTAADWTEDLPADLPAVVDVYANLKRLKATRDAELVALADDELFE